MNDLYCYKNSDVLINKYGITDYELLEKLEIQKCGNRILSIIVHKDKYVANKNSFDLLVCIHKTIFEDLYEWAGEFIKIDIYKPERVLSGGSVEYSFYKNIEKELCKLFDEKHDFNFKNEDDICDFIASLWQIHPFREGNTRTCMLFSWIYFQQQDINLDYDLIQKIQDILEIH